MIFKDLQSASARAKIRSQVYNKKILYIKYNMYAFQSIYLYNSYTAQLPFTYMVPIDRE